MMLSYSHRARLVLFLRAYALSLSDERNRLEEYYQVDINGVWSLDEIYILASGLLDLEIGFGGLKYFLAVFSNTSLERERIWKSNGQEGDLAQTTLIGDKITFFDSAFALDFGKWSVVHEFGHVFDSRFINQPDPKLWNDGFEWISNIWGATVRKNSTRMLWFRQNNAPSIYGSTSLKEDFAESFAGVIYNQGDWQQLSSGDTLRLPPNQRRKDYISRLIISFQLKVDNDDS